MIEYLDQTLMQRVWLLIFLMAVYLLVRYRSILFMCYLWFWGLPGLSTIRAKLTASPPLFGERYGVEWHKRSFGEDFPEFVIPPRVRGGRPNRILRYTWLTLVFVPYLIYRTIKHLMIVIATMTPEKGKPMLIFNPSASKFRHIGEGAVRGGKKGASRKKESDDTARRNQKIMHEAKILVESGREPHEIAGLLHSRFSKLPGYPGSITQYRNIIRSFIKQEKEKKRKSAS